MEIEIKIIKKIIVSYVLTLVGLSLTFANQDKVEAVDTQIQDKSNEISYDNTYHSDEVVYIKHCLKQMESLLYLVF